MLALASGIASYPSTSIHPLSLALGLHPTLGVPILYPSPSPSPEGGLYFLALALSYKCPSPIPRPSPEGDYTLKYYLVLALDPSLHPLTLALPRGVRVSYTLILP